MIACSAGDGTTTIWNVASGDCRCTIKGRGDAPGFLRLHRAIAFSEDEAYLATATSEDPIILWSVRSGEKVAELQDSEGFAGAIAFATDATRVAARNTKRVQVWDIHSGAVLQQFESGYVPYRLAWSGPCEGIAWSPDNDRLAAGSDHDVRIWDSQSGQEVCVDRKSAACKAQLDP